MGEHGTEIKPTNSDRKAREISRQLAQVELAPVPAGTEIDTTGALKLSLSCISELGVAFASVPNGFRIVTQQISLSGGEQLYRAILPKGANALKMAKDGKFWGAAKVGSSSKMVKFAATSGATAGTASIVMPYDPTALFMAATLVQINQKLDRIESTQREMLEFMRDEARARVQASLQALTRILNDYGSNWEKERWLQGSYNEVRSIQRESEAELIRLQDEIKPEVEKRSAIQTRQQVAKRLAGTVARFKDYQTALYVYSFASFLEPLLGEEYDREYLNSVSSRIRLRQMEYRELYTRCCDIIEASGQGAVDAVLMDGASKMGRAMGRALAATPIGKATPIDEALEKAGDSVGKASAGQTEALMAQLAQARVPDVVPFSESIERVNEFYNSDIELLMDGESIYLLPCAGKRYGN